MSYWEYANKLERKNLRVTYYGPTRSGKTHSAATWPRPLFIFPANENSEETIRGMPIAYKRVSSIQDMNSVLDVLLAAQNSGCVRDFADTIVVESLTHYTELIEQEHIRGGKEGMDWGAYSAHFKHMRDVLWQLDCHVVITALDMIKVDKNKNVIGAGMQVPGKAGETLPSSCDLVVYFEQLAGAAGPSWTAHVQRYGHFNAGTRIRGMPHGSFPNFNFTEHVAPYITVPKAQTQIAQ